jgi:hypothetical protein
METGLGFNLRHHLRDTADEAAFSAVMKDPVSESRQLEVS